MNLYSLFSVILATAFGIGGLYCVTRKRKVMLNVFALLVMLSLSWWSLCNAFFFSSATEAEAWRWHRLASIGWTGFIPATTYYFIILTGLNERMRKWWAQLIFYALPTTLILHNLFGSCTALATGLTRSLLGGQWTYVNRIDSVSMWSFMICLCGYFGFAFFLLLRWARRVHHKQKRLMAVSFVVLDAMTILLGFITDVYMPLTVHWLPAIANLASALFGVGYFFFIIRFDLFNLLHVVEDRDIVAHCTETMLVMDESGEVLYCNDACATLFGTDMRRFTGQTLGKQFDAVAYADELIAPLTALDTVHDVELSARLSSGTVKQLLISASVIRDRQKDFLGVVVSLRDVTQINSLRERYRRQSDEYQRLALRDSLTGLPNRRKTFEVLQDLAKNYAVTGADFFILYMDMNHFKKINDRYGHNMGDEFLVAVSRRLTGCLNDEMSFVGRLGGDEFLAIGSNMKSRETVMRCKMAVEQACSRPFQLSSICIHSGISVGYALFSEHSGIDDMVCHADAFMYKMKQRRRCK